MTDELLMRMWNARHDRLAADPRRPFLDAPGPSSRGGQRRPLHGARNTMLSALAAIATITVLFASAAALATPGFAHAAAVPVELA